MIQNFDRIIENKKWHEFHVFQKGCRIQVFYDEEPVFDWCDKTFSNGRIGLWTQSDAVTYFDNIKLRHPK